MPSTAPIHAHPRDPDPETFSAAVFAAFEQHFGRAPLPGNAHDAACLMQMDIFEQTHGRAPNTSNRNDLRTLQAIELETMPDAAAEFAAGNELINRIEGQMRSGRFEAVECPVTHRFTPGLYIRELLHPKGVLTATKIHKTAHPFTISQGSAMVSTGDGEWHKVQAPYTGITLPGTRRLIFALDDMVITTYHPTTKTDLAEIEADLIYPHSVEPALPEAPAPLLIATEKNEPTPGNQPDDGSDQSIHKGDQHG